MGAQEYWRLDRMGDNYGEPLVGERLVDGEYVRFELHTEPERRHMVAQRGRLAWTSSIG